MVDIAKFAMFFDNFGVVCFLFIIGYSAYHLWQSRKKKKFDVPTLLLLIIGLSGLVVDGITVGTNILNPLSWFKSPLSQGTQITTYTPHILYSTITLIIIGCSLGIYFIMKRRRK
jgi:Kef-type K+ transport system membrane component KefB